MVSSPKEQYPYLRPSRSDVRARTILARFTTRDDPCASTHRTRRNRQIVLETKGELSVQVLSQSFQNRGSDGCGISSISARLN
jgi:hypothetical protein